MLTLLDVAGADNNTHGQQEKEAHLQFVEMGIPPHYKSQ